MPPNTANGLAKSDHFKHDEITAAEIPAKKKLCWYQTETEIIWPNVIFLTTLHILSLYYYITFPYFDHKVLVLWTFVTTHLIGLGVTGGAHRLWSHRTYKATLPLRIFLAILFYSSGQNKIHSWVRDHRVHHKYTDTEADPHDNTRGFWFSHVGWLMLKKKPEVFQRGKGIDMSDILEDQVVQFFDKRYTFFHTLFTFILPIFIPVYFLKQDLMHTFILHIFVRWPWMLNVTWAVNSFAHMFGYRNYDKSIRPTQNIFVAFLAGGEGWHNYHHVFPWDYRGAEFKGVFFNITTLWIDLFAKLGLAYDLRQATSEHIEKMINKKGDHNYHLAEFLSKATRCA